MEPQEPASNPDAAGDEPIAQTRAPANPAGPTREELDSALRVLAGFRGVDFRSSPDSLLPRPIFETLDRGRDALDLAEPWALEMLFRCALAYGGDATALRHWAHRYGAAAARQGIAPRHIPLLSLDHLEKIDAHRDQLEVPGERLEQILKSEIEQRPNAGRDNVWYWARRLRDHEF